MVPLCMVPLVEIKSKLHNIHVGSNPLSISGGSLPRIRFLHSKHYTAKNATDLMQVVDFTSLMQFANKLCQAC